MISVEKFLPEFLKMYAEMADKGTGRILQEIPQ